jgi:hypothetical protein
MSQESPTMPRRPVTLDEVLATEPAVVEDVPAVMRSLHEPITHHPDGWYWQSADGRQEFGPFPSHEAARADMRGGDPEDLAPGETLQEAESEIGIADWIDPETGDPAEGLSRPHFDNE